MDKCLNGSNSFLVWGLPQEQAICFDGPIERKTSQEVRHGYVIYKKFWMSQSAIPVAEVLQRAVIRVETFMYGRDLEIADKAAYHVVYWSHICF